MKFKSQITNVSTHFLTTKSTTLHTRLLWLFRKCEKLRIRDWEFEKSCCLLGNNHYLGISLLFFITFSGDKINVELHLWQEWSNLMIIMKATIILNSTLYKIKISKLLLDQKMKKRCHLFSQFQLPTSPPLVSWNFFFFLFPFFKIRSKYKSNFVRFVTSVFDQESN